jgi:hypothetical protein
VVVLLLALLEDSGGDFCLPLVAPPLLKIEGGRSLPVLFPCSLTGESERTRFRMLLDSLSSMGVIM